MVSKTITAVALGICSALAAASAGAATITWNFTNGGWTETGAGNFGNTLYKTVDGVKATASAWSSTFNSGNTQIENAYLGLYDSGGLGVTNRDGTNNSTSCPGSGGTSNDRCEGTIGMTQSPEHAVDNNERVDSVRIQFGSQVNLASLVLGYVSGDADITVLASNGAALDTRTYGNGTGLLAAGWTFIGNYANISQGSTKQITNSTYATDWLIIAYNPAFGTGTNLQSGDDFFKVKLVTGDTPNNKVSEPGTLLLLFAAAAVGLWRRRQSG